MYAVKLNRQYTITEAEADRYRDEGYDIVDDDGKTVLQAGKGKTVPYAKYQEALDQVADLKVQLDSAAGKKKE